MSRSPAAIIADIHGNTPALRAVLAEIDAAGIGRLYVFGDVVNALDPGGCCDLLRARRGVCPVKGNAEEYACTEDIDGFPWQDMPEWRWIVPRVKWIRDRIGDRHLAWIRGWPETLRIGSALLLHDSPADRLDARSGPADLPEKYHKMHFHGKGIHGLGQSPETSRNVSLLKRDGATTLFCAHTHVPFVDAADGVTVCNAGSVGMPLDRDNRACWVSWEEGCIEIHRVAYDIEEAIELLRRTEYDVDARSVERYVAMVRRAVHWKEL